MTPADLKAWRAAQHVNQEQLAAKLGVHEITVSRWERGTVPIPFMVHLALWAIEHNAPRPYRSLGAIPGVTDERGVPLDHWSKDLPKKL